MEQVAVIPLTQQEADPKPSFTLEQAREQIRSLMREAESNAWEIGDLLNRIEKSGIARSKGYGKTRSWLEAEVPEVQGKTTTLYRYANVASHYTKEQVQLWGIARLEYLMVHDQETARHPVPGNPAQREVELVQEDGSKVVKKFCDCTSNELRSSNQRRKKTKGEPSAAAVTDAPDAANPETYSPWQALAMLGLGIVITPLAELLPSPVSLWIALVGFCLFFAGLGMLIHHWRAIWKRFLSAVKEGRGIPFLRETLANVRQGAQKLAAAIHSGVKTNPPTHSEKSPPPTEKKAA